ncbi:MAG: amino acid ABC transporter permease [Chloroflexi bacterium]|nr:amino acid ABC transporter permease [Chloroflexota bacterium]
MTNLSSASKPGFLLPPQPPGPIKWLRDNLFNGWFNSLLTLFSSVVVFFILTGFARWAITEANWEPVIRFPTLYAVGQYPRDELWRVGFGISALAFLIGASWQKWGGVLKGVALFLASVFAVLALLPTSHPQLTVAMRAYFASVPFIVGLAYWLARSERFSKRGIIILWMVYPIATLIVLNGVDGIEFLRKVSTTAWGGLLVTFLLAVGGILLSFPIGVALALGRRSSLPVVSLFSTFFIETIRGVPLITLLFMFSVILALFLPPEARIDRLVRALMAMTFFSAAYTAENVRGGLQSIPPGQIEAAKALGMNGVQTMGLIVLPQAIRAVIPAIAGQFITLFKDTTLVVIVGINDLLGIGRSIVNSDPQYVQAQLEVYLFIAAIFWIFSYFMSLASRRLETSLGVGKR